jgi:hypothetical protein
LILVVHLAAVSVAGDFVKEFNTKKKIVDVIRSGSMLASPA